MLQIDAASSTVGPGNCRAGSVSAWRSGARSCASPRFFLFDEPLSNLDAGLRVSMRGEIARLHKLLGTTMIYVTHDQVEAMTTGRPDRRAGRGRGHAGGQPERALRCAGEHLRREVHRQPADQPTALQDDGTSIRLAAVAAVDPGRPLSGRAAFVGVRAEDLTIVDPQRALIPAKVDSWEYLGSDVSVTLEAGPSGLVTARVSGGHRFAEGELVGLDFAPSAAHFFGPTGERV